MAKLVIEGRTRLSGEYYLSGSKNSSLSTMVAAALSDDTVILDNIPANTDVGAHEYPRPRWIQLGENTYEISGRGFQFQSHRMTWSGV